MSGATRYATAEPTICGVCRRRAAWFGYAPRQNSKPMWLCASLECAALAKKTYPMSDRYLDAFEHGATMEAADAAFGYLAEIGRFDIREINDQELSEFRRRWKITEENSMRRKILSDEIPF